MTIGDVARPEARVLELLDVRFGETQVDGVGRSDVLPGLPCGTTLASIRYRPGVVQSLIPLELRRHSD
jgi:hypothetical protein